LPESEPSNLRCLDLPNKRLTAVGPCVHDEERGSEHEVLFLVRGLQSFQKVENIPNCSSLPQRNWPEDQLLLGSRHGKGSQNGKGGRDLTWQAKTYEKGHDRRSTPPPAQGYLRQRKRLDSFCHAAAQDVTPLEKCIFVHATDLHLICSCMRFGAAFLLPLPT
jgi:hypothetical protein